MGSFVGFNSVGFWGGGNLVLGLGGFCPGLGGSLVV